MVKNIGNKSFKMKDKKWKNSIIEKMFFLMTQGRFSTGFITLILLLTFIFSGLIITEPVKADILDINLTSLENGGTFSGDIDIDFTVNQLSGGTVYIWHSLPSSLGWMLIDTMDITEDGDYTYTWDSTTVDDHSQYKVKVSDEESGQNAYDYDESNEFFTVDNTNDDIFDIDISYPNGGETLSGTESIQFDVIGDGDVYIYYVNYLVSETWNYIGSDSVSEGSNSFSWDTTSVYNGDEYTIVIDDGLSGEYQTTDESNDYFTIANNVEPDIAVNPSQLHMTIEEPGNNKQSYGEIGMMEINSPPVPPVDVSDTIVLRENIPRGEVILGEVPTSEWTYGCTATSAAMLFGYYDRTGFENMYTGPTNGGVCPLTDLGQGVPTNPRYPISGSCHIVATEKGLDGVTEKAHVDDYWISNGSSGPDPWEGNWNEHTWALCTADFIGTNQWKWDFSSYPSVDGTIDCNTDGSTLFWYYTDGSKMYDWTPGPQYGTPDTSCSHGVRLFAESRGYMVEMNYNQLTDNQHSNGFSLAEFQMEIDNNRPVLIHVEGHTMVGVGYQTSSDVIYIHDTWDNNVHSMTWGGSYSGMDLKAVTVLHLKPLDEYENLTVTNVGIADLTVSNISIQYQSGEPTEWLDANPKSFTLIPGTSKVVNISVFTSSLNPGIYHASITIQSNDPDESSLIVPVTLHYISDSDNFSRSIIADTINVSECHYPTRHSVMKNIVFSEFNNKWYVFYCNTTDDDIEVLYQYTSDFESWNTHHVFNYSFGARTRGGVSVDVKGSQICLVVPNTERYSDFQFITGTLQSSGIIHWNPLTTINNDGTDDMTTVMFDNTYFVSSGGDWDSSWRAASIWESSDGVNWTESWKSSAYANYFDKCGHFVKWNNNQDLLYIFTHDYDETDLRAVYYNTSSGLWEGEEDIGYDKQSNYHIYSIGSGSDSNLLHIVWRMPSGHLGYGCYNGSGWSSAYDVSSAGYAHSSILRPNLWCDEDDLIITYINEDTGMLERVQRNNGNWQSATYFASPFGDTIEYPTSSSFYLPENFALIWTDINGSTYSIGLIHPILGNNSVNWTLSCLDGWNLITIPFQTSWMASDLLTLMPNATLVSWYDTVNETYKTATSGGGYDFPLQCGWGYFVYVTNDSNVTVDGSPCSNVSVSLDVGWNMIGWYHDDDTMASSLMQNISNCTMISWYDTVSQTFKTRTSDGGYDFIISQGMGVFVYTTEASMWYGEG